MRNRIPELLSYAARVRPCARQTARGFTLLELLVVMGIMVMMMSMGVAGFFHMRRGAELRGASAMVQTTLMLARQQAVTMRHDVSVSFFQNGQTNGLLVGEVVSGVTNILHEPVTLSPGIEYDGTPPDVIIFKSTGMADGVASSDVNLREKAVVDNNKRQKATITVWHLTGVAKVH